MSERQMTDAEKDRFLGMIDEQHAQQIRATQRKMLKGVPPEGALYSRKILRALIRTAFRAGVIVERFDKQKPGKN